MTQKSLVKAYQSMQHPERMAVLTEILAALKKENAELEAQLAGGRAAEAEFHGANE